MNPRKLLAEAVRSPSGLRFRELVALVEAFGFEFRRQRGSHRIDGRADVSEILNLQPTKDGEAKDVQFEHFLKLVERHGPRLEDGER